MSFFGTEEALEPLGQRDRLEHLRREVARPAIATWRLSLAGDGRMICGLRRHYLDGPVSYRPPSTAPSTYTFSRWSRSSWAELLRRVFAVDVLTCPHCGGPRRLIAQLTDPIVVRRILGRLGLPPSLHGPHRRARPNSSTSPEPAPFTTSSPPPSPATRSSPAARAGE